MVATDTAAAAAAIRIKPLWSANGPRSQRQFNLIFRQEGPCSGSIAWRNEDLH